MSFGRRSTKNETNMREVSVNTWTIRHITTTLMLTLSYWYFFDYFTKVIIKSSRISAMVLIGDDKLWTNRYMMKPVSF